MDYQRKKLLIFTGLAGLVILLLYLFYSWSFVEVVIKNPDTGNTPNSFSFTGRNAKTSTVKDTKNSVRKFLPRDSYEVLVSRGDKTAVAIAESKGFLKTSTVEVEILEENSVAYVGDSPSPCTAFAVGNLYSYECSSGSGLLSFHVPASSRAPSFVQKDRVQSKFYGEVEDVVQLENKAYALMDARNQTLDAGSEAPGERIGHGLFETKNNGKRIMLDQLARSTTYKLRNYGSGFYAIDSNLVDVWFYSSPEGSGQKVNINLNDDTASIPAIIEANDSGLLATYSNISKEETIEEGLADPTTPNEDVQESADYSDFKNKLALYDKNSMVGEFSINGSRVVQAIPCGHHLACVLTNTQTLEVWEVTHDRPEVLYSFFGVNDFTVTGGSVILMQKQGAVHQFNTKTNKGRVSLPLRDRVICGIQPVSDERYLLCTIDQSRRKRALLIDTKSIAEDKIDQKIDALAQADGVASVSINRNYIFIVSHPITSIYDDKRKIFKPDPIKYKKIRQIINNEINALNIDRNKYEISISAS